MRRDGNYEKNFQKKMHQEVHLVLQTIVISHP